MTVAELIEQLKQMPQDAHIYAEGELANAVIDEVCPDNHHIVRIFKKWNMDIVLGGDTEVRKKCGNCIHWKSKGVSSWGKCDAGHPKIKSFMRNGHKFNTCDYKSKTILLVKIGKKVIKNDIKRSISKCIKKHHAE